MTRTKANAKVPTTTKEYRRVMKVEAYSWLCMASRYRSKHWLHGLTLDPFNKFTEYILGDKVFGIQIPSSAGDSTQQKVRPEWSIVLAYEQKLRKEAMKKVLEGNTLADSLLAVIRGPDLKEAYFTTPAALKSSMSDAQPSYQWQRTSSKGNFGGEQSVGFSKGKGKSSKGKSKGKSIDQRMKGLSLAWRTPD